MKKILFSILAVSLAVASCTTFETEEPMAVVEATSPVITLGTAGDTGFSATIAAQEGTGFYSYAIVKGEPAEVNSTTLLKGKLGGALYTEVVDYAKKTSVSVTAENLVRNTTYTVYAIAASEQGTIGEVVYKSVTTSDSENPSPKSASYASGVFTLTFSEPVTYVEGKTATGAYYAINTPTGAEYDIENNIPVGNMDVTIAASGDKATFTVDLSKVPDGAYLAVSYPAGTFKDVTGNECAALTSGYGVSNGKLASAGLTGRVPVKAFDLKLYEEGPLEIVSNLANAIWISVPETFVYYKYDNTLKGSFEIKGATYTKTYEFAGFPDYGWNGTYNCALTYPYAAGYTTTHEEPERGDKVTITIPAGFLTDIYGNTSNQLVIGPFLYSYGYTRDDFLGTYSIAATTQYAGEQAGDGIIIAPDSESEDGVLIYNLFAHTTCCDDLDSFTYLDGSYFEASVNVDSGIIAVEYDAIGTGVLSSYSWENYVLALSFETDDKNFNLQMPVAGTIEFANVVAIYLNSLGTWDRYQSATLTRTSEDYTVPSASSVPAPCSADLSKIGVNLK